MGCSSSNASQVRYNEVLTNETLGIWVINVMETNSSISTYILKVVDTGEVDVQKETKIYNVLYNGNSTVPVFANNKSIKAIFETLNETLELNFAPFNKSTLIHGRIVLSNGKDQKLFGYRPYLANKQGFLDVIKDYPWRYETMKKIYRWQLSIPGNNKHLNDRFLVLFLLNEKVKNVYMCYWRGYYAIPAVYDENNLGLLPLLNCNHTRVCLHDTICYILHSGVPNSLLIIYVFFVIICCT